MSRNASIDTCKNGEDVIACNARAVALFPTLPTPLRMIMRGVFVRG
jgi:hypothetical protein